MFAEGNFQDPHNARLLYLASGGLLLLGLALGIGTWLWWRSSKVEHPALGPLEVMSQRSWLTDDFVAQRRRLDEARPEGAERQFVPPVEVELRGNDRDLAAHFDDLSTAEESPEAEVDVDADAAAAAVPAQEAPLLIDPLLRVAEAPVVEPVDPAPEADDTPA